MKEQKVKQLSSSVSLLVVVADSSSVWMFLRFCPFFPPTFTVLNQLHYIS